MPTSLQAALAGPASACAQNGTFATRPVVAHRTFWDARSGTVWPPSRATIRRSCGRLPLVPPGGRAELALRRDHSASTSGKPNVATSAGSWNSITRETPVAVGASTTMPWARSVLSAPGGTRRRRAGRWLWWRSSASRPARPARTRRGCGCITRPACQSRNGVASSVASVRSTCSSRPASERWKAAM